MPHEANKQPQTCHPTVPDSRNSALVSPILVPYTGRSARLARRLREETCACQVDASADAVQFHSAVHQHAHQAAGVRAKANAHDGCRMLRQHARLGKARLRGEVEQGHVVRRCRKVLDEPDAIHGPSHLAGRWRMRVLVAAAIKQLDSLVALLAAGTGPHRFTMH